MNTETVEQVAQRALELIRDRHHFRFAVIHAVFEFGGDEDDFWKVLPVLKELVEREDSLKFVARKMARAMDKPSEPEEFQTCFPGFVHHVFD